MKNYVLGFMFSKCKTHVAMIRKNSPQWQRGRLNGIGGKMKSEEEPVDAMRREFAEETGLEVPTWDWTYFLELSGKGWKVHCFASEGDLSKLQSITEEKVEILQVANLPTGIIHNSKWMIPMALDSDLRLPVRIEDVTG